MSPADATDLLSPEGAALTSPEQVERALAALWGPAGTDVARESPATRVSLANLVVIGSLAESSALLESLSELATVFPARTLLVLDDPSVDSAAIRASVSAVCHVPQPGEPQVCAEQIVLRTSLEDAGDLGRTILPLLEEEVPVHTWWTLDPARHAGIFGDLRSLSVRLIVDAGREAFSHLDSTPGCAVRELGWYRIARWREQVAGMFDECGADTLRTLDDIVIEVSQRHERAVTHAIWLAAFLGGQLGWEPAEAARGVYRLRSSGGDVRVRLARSESDWHGILALQMAGGENRFEMRRRAEQPDELRIAVHETHVCRMPRSMRIPRIRRSAALAQALAGRPVDAAFDRALPLASWMASCTG